MKKAIILFNLGGPDSLNAVEPFLFNLFNDPAIISLPSFFRYPLAKLISKRRAPIAKAIYAEMGGKSPILQETQLQADAIEDKYNTLKLYYTISDEAIAENKYFRIWMGYMNRVPTHGNEERGHITTSEIYSRK